MVNINIDEDRWHIFCSYQDPHAIEISSKKLGVGSIGNIVG